MVWSHPIDGMPAIESFVTYIVPTRVSLVYYIEGRLQDSVGATMGHGIFLILARSRQSRMVLLGSGELHSHIPRSISERNKNALGFSRRALVARTGTHCSRRRP